MRFTNKCYAFDEFLGGFSACRASVDKAETPLPLYVSCEQYRLVCLVLWLTIRDVHCLTPSSDLMIAAWSMVGGFAAICASQRDGLGA